MPARGRNWPRNVLPTEIDYWKRYQSYKHSLPLILQSCDVEPSHRPSLLIPPLPVLSFYPHPFPSLLRLSFSLSASPSFAFLSVLPRKPRVLIAVSRCSCVPLRNGVYRVVRLYRLYPRTSSTNNPPDLSFAKISIG